MVRTRLTVLALAVFVAAGFSTASAFAQADATPAAAAPGAADATPVKAKPKKAKSTATIAVVITNHRSVALKELGAAGAGGPTNKKIVTDLKPGDKKTVKLGKGKDCLYDFHAAYEDGTSADLSSVDICKDKTIDLVE